MKVALVHDYLREYGGAERVLETLHEMFPDAPVYVSFFDQKALGNHAARFADWDIRETKLIQLPFYKKLFSPYRVFSAWAFESLDLAEFDVVISSTNMYMAKAVNVKEGARHISYIHTPPRSLYGFSTQMQWKKNPIIRIGGELINFWMRYVDFKTAQRPEVLIANSKTTQERIQKFYRRESIIIPPPVEMVEKTEKEKLNTTREYALFVGRLTRSKHPDLAIQAAKSADISLKIVGTAGLFDDLQKYASESVEFLGAVSDEQLKDIYLNAKVLLFPAEDEDFGIVPIEAMACGVPVIAHYSGEPRYTVEDGENGFHAHGFTIKEWSELLTKAWKKDWNRSSIRESVKIYSSDQFKMRISNLIKRGKI